MTFPETRPVVASSVKRAWTHGLILISFEGHCGTALNHGFLLILR